MGVTKFEWEQVYIEELPSLTDNNKNEGGGVKKISEEIRYDQFTQLDTLVPGAWERSRTAKRAKRRRVGRIRAQVPADAQQKKSATIENSD